MNNNTATLSIEEEKQRAIAAIDRKAQIAKEHQLKIAQLTKAVTVAETALVEFESKRNFLRQRKAQLQQQLLGVWPQQASDLSLQINTSPILAVAESYGTILAIDAALEDEARVRKHLNQQLHVAKQNLADFQR